MFELVELDTTESHGEYETLSEACGAALYDRLKAFEIWNVVCHGR